MGGGVGWGGEGGWCIARADEILGVAVRICQEQVTWARATAFTCIKTPRQTHWSGGRRVGGGRWHGHAPPRRRLALARKLAL